MTQISDLNSENEKETPMDWIVCGRAIGKASGWDQSDTFELMLYDFEPALGVDIPASECLTFRFENGTIEKYADNGEIVWSADLIDTLRDAKVERTD